MGQVPPNFFCGGVEGNGKTDHIEENKRKTVICLT